VGIKVVLNKWEMLVAKGVPNPNKNQDDFFLLFPTVNWRAPYFITIALKISMEYNEL
jgi:hypothetical protein